MYRNATLKNMRIFIASNDMEVVISSLFIRVKIKNIRTSKKNKIGTLKQACLLVCPSKVPIGSTLSWSRHCLNPVLIACDEDIWLPRKLCWELS